MVEETAINVENKEKSVEKNAESDNIAENTKVYTLEILHMIKDGQQQHGLRHGDYQRYRGYCTRRIRRLRKALKYPQGDKRHFKRKDVTITNLIGKNADERFIHIPLMSAERAWSYAMQLRQEANTEPRKKFHLTNKLRKACFYALQLQELCQSDCFDARSKLEAEAYTAWMHGSLHFELSLWKSAAEHLKKSQVIYDNLAKALPEEEQSIYKAKVDELTPSLRYCSYNIGGEDGTSVDDLLELRAKGLLDNLDVLVKQTKSESNESSQTVEWRNRKVTVRPEKVRLFLLSVQELNKSLEKAKDAEAKIQLIENILMDCKDAITAVKDEIKQDPKLRAGGTTGIQYLLSYLHHIRLIRTVERNMYLVEQAKLSFDDPNQNTGAKVMGKRIRSQDLTRLYEIILQNVTEMQQINGMEEDTGYQNECDVLAMAFKAFRCYYIALTLIEMKKWKEAVSLYERSINYAGSALQSKPEKFNLTNDLNILITTIEGCKFSAHAYSVLEHDEGEMDSTFYTKSQKISKPLYERLSQYKEDQSLNTTKNPNVYKLTPEMEAIPCKPFFFDLALNYVELPDELNDKVQQYTGKKAGAGNAPAAGISGFVKGFLGWGGKK